MKDTSIQQKGKVWLIALLVVAVVTIVAIVALTDEREDDNGRQNEQIDESDTEVGGITEYDDLIRITQPERNATISSPLTVSGEARGMWYFEASFPIHLLDGNGNPIPIEPGYIMTDANWMTEDYVPFSATFSFSPPATETGTLILERSNPSGLPENADQVEIPVRFELEEESAERTIQLYYYNPANDLDAEGNVVCSEAGLVAVERDIPVTQTPIQDAIRLLLQGEVTTEEVASGVTTEFPLSGLELTGANLVEGRLTLSFNDPNNSTSGGSCRARILWAQVAETALQFDAVDEVRFEPEELFQP